MATKADRKALFAAVGSPEDAAEEMARFRDSAALLSSRHPRLIDRYEKQWVAVYQDKVLAHATSFDAVIREIDQGNVPRRHVLIRFIEKNQRTMILWSVS